MFNRVKHSTTTVITYCERCFSACGSACRAAVHRDRVRDKTFRQRLGR